MDSLEQQLDEGRRKLQVTREELAEARARRDKISKALQEAFPGGRTYVNGSVAHGDANTPLTDVDLGIVVETAGRFGPTGLGPAPLMEIARDAIKDAMKSDYPKLTVTIEGQKRAVLVRFGDPVTAGQADFTADVIVALDNADAAGLFIPNLTLPEGWDRAHPEKHTQLIVDATEATNKNFPRVIRLLKHWRDRHGKPLCSWNVKALALECIAEGDYALLSGLDLFFSHAARALRSGLTDDPAHVAGKIKLPKEMPRADAVWRLGVARDHVKAAISHELEGRPALAQHELHAVLPEVIGDSDPGAQKAEEAARLRKNVTMSSLVTGSVLPTPTPTRAWAPRR